MALASRDSVVSEARSWIGTKYHKNARVKGAGCDCATLLFCVYHVCGLIPEEETGIFAGDWWAHVTEEIYMQRIIRHAAKIAEGIACRGFVAEPGNILLTRAANSRVYNHAGIATCGSKVIHAITPHVSEVDIATHPMWTHHEIAIFDPWKRAEPC